MIKIKFTGVALSLAFFLAFTSLAMAAVPVDKEYIINKGDSLLILVWGEDSLTTDVTVRPDGRITFPGQNTMIAAGLTSRQLQSNISSSLSRLVHSPMVTVIVRGFANNKVVVHGPGITPAVVTLTGKTSLLEVLSRSTPQQMADLKNAYLERDGTVIARDFYDLYRKGNSNENMEVLAGDRIYIPLSEGRSVCVEGAVNKPSTIGFYEGITVMEAIHQAGGFSKFASRNKTYVYRKKSNNDVVAIRVRLDDLTDKGDFKQNIMLEGGDVIVVKKGWF